MKTAAVILVLMLAASAAADPEPMTRDEIIELAESGVGFSYWWGHDQWDPAGGDPGTCTGSCPDCTHTGLYGADCSGFASKVWQVPDPVDLTTYHHPYSTREFRYNNVHWDTIDRGDIQRGDALVYRNDTNTGGHIVIYDHGNSWGETWTYEARGCSYGIVYNLRSISSSYVAIRRHNLIEDPDFGLLVGVVFEEDGTGEMTVRIPGALVALDGGDSVTARDGDAYWSFELPPGFHTVNVSADGYESASRTCKVDIGHETWCSVGLVPICVPDCGGRECGPDPLCGQSCGDCPADHGCTPEGQCHCQPDCTGLECGPDPVCGEDCGTCSPDETCDQTGVCQAIEEPSGTLTGTVVKLSDRQLEPNLQNGTPVGGAMIALDSGQTTRADQSGRFEFVLPPAAYLLTASANDLEDGQANCSVVAGQVSECIVPVYEKASESGEVSGGCCATAEGSDTVFLLLFLFLAIPAARSRP